VRDWENNSQWGECKLKEERWAQGGVLPGRKLTEDTISEVPQFLKKKNVRSGARTGCWDGVDPGPEELPGGVSNKG